MQINIFSARITLHFTGNKPAGSAFESAELDEYHGRPRKPSTSASHQTLVEDRELGPLNTIDWIAGVGDISHGTSRDGNFDIDTSLKQDVQRRVPSKCPHERGDTIKLHNNNQNPNTKRSALRRHCDFWDADNDGVIYPWDIFTGFRKLGFNIALCLWAAVTMSLCSSYSTQTGWLPSFLFAIDLKNVHCNRHGSTTGAYDLDAELDTRRFDAIFDKYADGEDYLTRRTLYNVWKGQCCANDFFGWFAGGLECESCYW
jgi:hypothetical protein